MKYVIYYWSRYGHNKKIVEYIESKLKKGSDDVTVMNVVDADPGSVPDADLYVFSASAEAFNVQKYMRKFMKKLSGMGGKKYAIINTHAMRSKNWLGKMEKLLSKSDMVKVAATDFVVGSDGQKEGNGLPNAWEGKIDDFVTKLK